MGKTGHQWLSWTFFGILVSQSLTTNLGQSLLNNDADPERAGQLVRPRTVTDTSSDTLALKTDGTFSFIPVFNG